MKPILSVDEVAELLECTPKTVENQLRARELPGVKLGVGWVCPTEALIETLNDLARRNLGVKMPDGKPPAPEQITPIPRGRKARPAPSLSP